MGCSKLQTTDVVNLNRFNKNRRDLTLFILVAAFQWQYHSSRLLVRHCCLHFCHLNRLRWKRIFLPEINQWQHGQPHYCSQNTVCHMDLEKSEQHEQTITNLLESNQGICDSADSRWAFSIGSISPFSTAAAIAFRASSSLAFRNYWPSRNSEN